MRRTIKRCATAGSVRHSTSGLSVVKPVLAWEGAPAPMTANDEKRVATIKAADIRYDLRVWRSVDDSPAEIVYQRDGLDRPERRLETALKPGWTYFWSVRLRYRADGQPRATRWSAANVQGFIPPMPIGDALYCSRNEGETVKPVPCKGRDLTPCGCLDFIPRHNFFRFRTP